MALRTELRSRFVHGFARCANRARPEVELLRTNDYVFNVCLLETAILYTCEFFLKA